VRAASTGISTVVSPEGRVVERSQMFRPAILTAKVALVKTPQPGPRFGPLVGWGLMGLAIAFVIAPAAVPRRRRKAR